MASWLVYLIPGASIFSLLVAVFFIWDVLRQPKGTERMQEVAGAIREGAMAFLNRQYRTIYFLACILAVALFVVYYFFSHDKERAVATFTSFLLGAICSGLAGFIGMWVAVQANVRAAHGARGSLNKAIRVAIRGGAVTGLFVVALSLIGVGGLYWLFGGRTGADEYIKMAPLLIVGYGFGASFVALFAQLGGGIYTKAADVGADLVGKIEVGIPEDDPRNPAVVADLVGDNVGDCAGRGADLFESTAAENIGAMILGIALYPMFGVNGILFPLVARAAGLIASVVGIFAVNAREKENPMNSLTRGYTVTSLISAAALWFISKEMFGGSTPGHPGIGGNYVWFFLAGLTGIVMSYAFVIVTQYYTEYRYAPVRSISKACTTGPATTIIQGVAVGFECVAIPVVVIVIAIMLAYHFGAIGMAGIPGITEAQGGLYGTAVATMGMLSTCAFVLAMDTFGPITDNAGGIAEMAQLPKDTREITESLDACGNSTKAITKGYAIGSAALAAFLLFQAYIEEVNKLLANSGSDARLTSVDVGKPVVFGAAFLGAMVVYLFSSFAIRAVGNAAQIVIKEVRRQFKEIKGIMDGTAKPDYAACVDIVTRGALREMVLPGLLVVVAPIIVGVLMKYEAVAGFLMIATIAGVILATFLNNSGGAWDNAKKWIETGEFGGKGSDAHKAGVVGDTVGDPFKDTAGPSLHVLIKLLSTITLVLAALFIH
jgi:K(+)-stimulated pyrophosphate-energized sodium pump